MTIGTEERMKRAFKEFFDEHANVEWTGWETEEQPGRVLIDAVFDLDELIRVLTRTASSGEDV